MTFGIDFKISDTTNAVISREEHNTQTSEELKASIHFEIEPFEIAKTLFPSLFRYYYYFFVSVTF